MSSTIKDGTYKPLSAFQKVNGLWVPISVWNKYQGVWYEVNSNGIKVIIDSATTIYDFNLKNFLISAGLWTPAKAITITELLVTERTVLTQDVLNERVSDLYGYYNATPPAEKKGYIRTLNAYNRNVDNTVYIGPFAVFSQNLSLYAFDTGSDWPAGSSIKVFNLKGTIYGRGGNGSGGFDNATSLAYNQNLYLPQPIAIPLSCCRQHGWPALKTTLPIETLNVSGLLAGGGAGGSLFGTVVASEASLFSGIDAIPVDRPVIQSDLIIAHSYLPGVNAPPNQLNGTVASGTNTQYGAGGGGVAPHGGGGGQGGGLSGRTNPAANQYTDASNYTNYVNGVPGTAGTLLAPGTASTSLISVDTKGKYFTGVTTYTTGGGGVRGGAWGEDSPSNTWLVGGLFAGTDYWDSPHPPTTLNLNTTNYRFSRTLKGWGGPAIKGVDLIQTILGDSLIKGRRVPSSYYF